MDDTAITNNTTGVQANGTIRLSNSDILFNGTAVTGTGVQTYGNNRIAGNGAVGTALAAAVSRPAVTTAAAFRFALRRAETQNKIPGSFARDFFYDGGACQNQRLR